MTLRNELARKFVQHLNDTCWTFDIWVDTRPKFVTVPHVIVGSACACIRLGHGLTEDVRIAESGLSMLVRAKQVSTKCFIPWGAFLAAEGRGESLRLRPDESPETLATERATVPRKAERRERAKALGIRRIK